MNFNVIVQVHEHEDNSEFLPLWLTKKAPKGDHMEVRLEVSLDKSGKCHRSK